MKGIRRRRALWVVVAVLAVAVAALFAFVWLGHNGPGIPHAVGSDRSDCTRCHTGSRLPDGHGDRAADTCRSCHSPKEADAGSGGEVES